MHAKLEEDDPGIFVLSRNTIRTIVNLVQPDFEEMAINASCNDQTFRGFESVEELTSYPNARASRINILSLNGYRGKSQNLQDFSLSWAIDERLSFSLVKLRIDGDSEKVSSLRSRIRDILEETRPWYWRISKFDIRQFFMILLAFFVLCAGFVFVELTYDIFSTESRKVEVDLPVMNWNTIKEISWLIISISIAGIVIRELIDWIIIRPKRYLFPSGVFLIGAEKTRHKNNEKFRFLFLGSVLPVLISIVITALFKL